MDLYNLITSNREILKIIYAVVVVLISTIIVLRTDKLFRLSSHNGIRYFRNAFFFYGIGFAIRFFIGSPLIYGESFSKYGFLINPLFEFFLVMAGFFLLYSLLWKKFEKGKDYPSSLLNLRILPFYFMAFIIMFLDYLWETHYFMFVSQVVLFAIASMVSFSNLRGIRSKARFSRFYFLAMLLSFLAWTLNTISLLLNWNIALLINVYVLNSFVFLLILFGVIKITK